jgi:hypothetical protein
MSSDICWLVEVSTVGAVIERVSVEGVPKPLPSQLPEQPAPELVVPDAVKLKDHPFVGFPALSVVGPPELEVHTSALVGCTHTK